MKKLILIFFAVVVSTELFAAQVSDNDGSSFITKAEFDSLKNDFQSQIDIFNKGIDSKIDTAISSYLDGIHLDTTQSLDIIQSDWGSVYFMNQIIAPTFRLPEYSCIFAYGAMSSYASNAKNQKQISLHGRNYRNFSWSSTETCIRPLFGLISGSESAIGSAKIYWRGIAQRYHESYIMGFAKNDKYADLANLDQFPSLATIYLKDFFRIYYTGYLSDLSSDAIFNPTSKFRYSNNSSGSSYTNVTPSSNNVYCPKIATNVTLDDYSGKTTEYDHIIQYDKSSSWCLSNDNFLNTFYVHSSNGNTDTTLYDNSTKDMQSQYIAFCPSTGDADGGASRVWANGVIGGTTYENSGSILASIGMIGNKQAGAIYQFEKNKTVSIDETNFTVASETLEKGMHLLAALKDDKITWEANFSEVYAYNGSSYVTNNHEVDIYLSYVPFTDKVTSTDLVQFKDSSGVTRNYVTTNGRKAELSWTQKKDSIMYVKCVPHFTGTSYLTSNWRVKLNLTSTSRVYTRKFSE